MTLTDRTGNAESTAPAVLVLPGDYNGDNAVDAADYTVWRDALDDTVMSYTGADGDGDGVIDEDDFGVWKAHFGQTAALGSGSAGTTLQQTVWGEASPQPIVASAPIVDESETDVFDTVIASAVSADRDQDTTVPTEFRIETVVTSASLLNTSVPIELVVKGEGSVFGDGTTTSQVTARDQVLAALRVPPWLPANGEQASHQSRFGGVSSSNGRRSDGTEFEDLLLSRATRLSVGTRDLDVASIWEDLDSQGDGQVAAVDDFFDSFDRNIWHAWQESGSVCGHLL